jgi:hypothetical protein
MKRFSSGSWISSRQGKVLNHENTKNKEFTARSLRSLETQTRLPRLSVLMLATRLTAPEAQLMAGRWRAGNTEKNIWTQVLLHRTRRFSRLSIRKRYEIAQKWL